ncbi:hypothetical protein II906_08020 [bacterium]|nr:hypothetical protein [bacterium]
MIKRHLRIVASSEKRYCNKTSFIRAWESITNRLENIFISEKEKIYTIREELIKCFRDYEITTGYMEEPYFIKAEKKLRRIIREKKVDYYYNLVKKIRSKTL